MKKRKYSIKVLYIGVFDVVVNKKIITADYKQAKIKYQTARRQNKN